MADKTLTPDEAAVMLGITPGRVRKLCRDGRVVGAKLFGRSWYVPQHIVVRPGRKRGPKPRA